MFSEVAPALLYSCVLDFGEGLRNKTRATARILLYGRGQERRLARLWIYFFLFLAGLGLLILKQTVRFGAGDEDEEESPALSKGTWILNLVLLLYILLGLSTLGLVYWFWTSPLSAPLRRRLTPRSAEEVSALRQDVFLNGLLGNEYVSLNQDEAKEGPSCEASCGTVRNMEVGFLMFIILCGLTVTVMSLYTVTGVDIMAKKVPARVHFVFRFVGWLSHAFHWSLRFWCTDPVCSLIQSRTRD